MFQSREGFVDKHFIKIHKKKKAQVKILEFLLLDTIKTTFSLENLTQRCTKSEPIFQDQDTFLNFQKRAEWN